MLNAQKAAITEAIEKDIAKRVQQIMEQKAEAHLQSAKSGSIEDPCGRCPIGGGCIHVVCKEREEWLERCAQNDANDA